MPHEIVQIGDCTLIHGDCLNVLPTLGKVDVVVTDPPFGINAAKKAAHSSIRDSAKWPALEWDNVRLPEHVAAYVAVASRAAVWGGNYYSDILAPSSAWLGWIKPEADTGFSMADMELCWTNTGKATRTRNAPRRDGNEHPTQKPVSVMIWTLEYVGGTGVVLDPFMSSGTTGVACIRTGRKFIGIEKHKPYFDIACDRIRREVELAKCDLFRPKPVMETQRSLFGEPV